jgi:WD40 repeat protein
MTTFDPKLAALRYTAETPLLLASCYDAAGGSYFGAGIDAAVYRLDTRADKPAADKPAADKPTPEKRWSHHDNYVSGLAWLDGTIISCGYDGRLVWTRAESGEKLREVMAHDGWIRDLALLPGGGQLATVGDDMRVKLWDAASGDLVRTLEGHQSKSPEGFATAIYAIAASPGGKLLASGDRIGHVCLWEVETGKLLTRLHAPEFYTYDRRTRDRSIGGIRALHFLPDGRLAIGGLGPVSNVDGFVGPARFELWDVQAGKMLHRAQDKHHAIVDHLAFLPDSNLMIGGGGGDAGPFLGFWDLATPSLAEAPLYKAKPKSHIHHFVFDPAAPRLLAVGHGGFQIWDFTGQEPPAEKKP